MDSMKELTQQRRIFQVPTLEELVNPIEEEENEDSPYQFEGGDAEIMLKCIGRWLWSRGLLRLMTLRAKRKMTQQMSSAELKL